MDKRATYKPNAEAAERIAAILAARPELDGSVSAAINWALTVAVETVDDVMTWREFHNSVRGIRQPRPTGLMRREPRQ